MRFEVVDNHRSRFVPVPPQWQQRKMRFAVSSYQTKKNEDENPTVLSLTKSGLKVKTDLSFGKSTENYVGHQIVEPGQFVFTPRDFDATPILCGVASIQGCISNLYIVFDVCSEIDPRFLEYYFWGLKYGFDFFEKLSFGMRYSFNRTQFENIPLLHPDLETQRQIAEFLDRETARIDVLIEKKQRLVALLDDHWDRFAFDLFSIETPTRFKIDKSNWRLQKLKFLSPEVTVGIVVTPAAYYTEDGVPAIRGTNIREMEIRLEDMVSITNDGHRINRKSTVSKDDIIVVRTGQPGTAAVVPEILDGANCIDVILVKQPEGYMSELLAHFLNSSVAKAQYSSGSSGAIQQHFNISIASNLVVPTPPLCEQERVLVILNQERRRIRRLKLALVASIDRLKEYRSALIAAAVTGQIDVQSITRSGAPDRHLDAIQEKMQA